MKITVLSSFVLGGIAFLLVGLLSTSTGRADQRSAEERDIEIAADMLDSAWNWSRLVGEVQSRTHLEMAANTFERWLSRSLEIYGHDLKVTREQLRDLWQQFTRHPDYTNTTQFLIRRLAAFDRAAERLPSFDPETDLPRAHRLFLDSQVAYPEEWALTYDHDRYAQFSLLAAEFSRARTKVEKAGGLPNPEWLYLEGRASLFIRVGGELHTHQFLTETRGQSPYARVALKALDEFLRSWERTAEDQAQASASLEDLRALIEAAQSEPVTSAAPVQARAASGIHPFGELLVAVAAERGDLVLTVHDWNGRIMSRRIFAELEFEALGGHAGLWLPVPQPVPNAFLLCKFGAYAGRTLLVQENGSLLEYPGGNYAYDAKSKRLFLQEVRDLDGLTTVLSQDLKPLGVALRTRDLRDANGKRVAVPKTFICLPELADMAEMARQQQD